MSRWIVLLRGINVGGTMQVRMTELRGALTAAGCAKVASYIQSGNLVFESALSRSEVSTLVTDVIEAEFGFRPSSLALKPEELTEALAENPFPETTDPKTVHLWFAEEVPDPRTTGKLEQLATETESWQLTGRVLYLHAPNGIGRSKLAARAEHKLGVPATARNMRTLTHLRTLSDQT